MRLISFNINGIQSMTHKIKNGEKKGGPTNNVILSLIQEQQPDILCLQELKTQSDGHMAWLKTYFPYCYTTFSTVKKGYSGVALLSKEEPEWVEKGFDRYSEDVIGEYGIQEFIHEGRIIVAKFRSHIVISVYTPNSQPELARIKERVAWEQTLRLFVIELRKEFDLPILIAGDLNCAPNEIDLARPSINRKSPGFSDQERSEFQNMIRSGFVDSFRELHPDRIAYTYFSNFAQSRVRNVGWRIDHVLVSEPDRHLIRRSEVLDEYFGSDHIPILIDFN
jgi:exodeoxyribonuclease-3